MRVLFLTRYPVEGASSRYRVYQYLPYLRNKGMECDVSPFMSAEMYRLVFTPGQAIKKGWYTMLASLRRLALLRKVKSYDLVFIQRECLPFGPPVMERLMRRWGIATIFDYDDALFIKKPSKYNALASWARRSDKIYEIFSLVDTVLAGNSYLREVAAGYCADARVVEVAEDTQRFMLDKPVEKNRNQVIIGWLGSMTTEKYLRLLDGPLQVIASRYPHVRLRIMGGGEYQVTGLKVEHLPWRLEDEVKVLNSFDIGIMPLPPEEWSKGKSGGKARTYMAAGVAPVATGIGYNLELIQHGVTGMLVTTEQDWIDALSWLIENPDRRKQMGEDAQTYTKQQFSIEKIAEELFSIITDVARKAREKQ